MINIKIGDLIITSKSRYGTVIDTKIENDIPICLIRIGKNSHWINRDQLTKADSVIRFKVNYSFNYCDKFIDDSIEIALKKDTLLFDNINNITLESIVKDQIKKQINQDVIINKILIS